MYGHGYSPCHFLFFYSFVLRQSSWRLQFRAFIWKKKNWWIYLESLFRNANNPHSLPQVKVNWSRYRPGVAQRVVWVIALLFHDRGTSRGWVVSSTPQPQFTTGKDPVPILQEAGCTPGPVWTGGKSRPHRDSIPDRPDRSQSLYRLCYPTHPYQR